MIAILTFKVEQELMLSSVTTVQLIAMSFNEVIASIEVNLRGF